MDEWKWILGNFTQAWPCPCLSWKVSCSSGKWGKWGNMKGSECWEVGCESPPVLRDYPCVGEPEGRKGHNYSPQARLRLEHLTSAFVWTQARSPSALPRAPISSHGEAPPSLAVTPSTTEAGSSARLDRGLPRLWGHHPDEQVRVKASGSYRATHGWFIEWKCSYLTLKINLVIFKEFHVNVWRKPLQYCKVICLQLIKISEKKKKEFPSSKSHMQENSS